MKRIALIMSLICLIITGCSNNNASNNVVDETKTINLANYEKVVYNNRELLSNWAYVPNKTLKKRIQGQQI